MQPLVIPVLTHFFGDQILESPSSKRGYYRDSGPQDFPGKRVAFLPQKARNPIPPCGIRRGVPE